MSGPGFTRPDLCSIRAAAEQAELAGAVRGLLSADGYPLADDGPLAPLAPDAARTLVETGFRWYHCDRHQPLCCPAGVCPMPIPVESGTGPSTIAVSRTSHDLLLDWDWIVTCSHICELVNAVPGSVPVAFGYRDRQHGTASACLVADQRGQRTEAGR